MLTTSENKSPNIILNSETSQKYPGESKNIKQSKNSPLYLFISNKSEINEKNENGWTPIYRSIASNNLEALYELLQEGADPNIPNNLGETPLYLSVDNNNYDALMILLQYKAKCNIAKNNGNTPLHIATKKNKKTFIYALLRNNANPNITNKLYSQTAMHLAIINKIDENLLNEFKNCGGNIYGIKDKYDKTPFDYAKDFDESYKKILIKIFGKNVENNEEKNLVTWNGTNNRNEINNNTSSTPVKINYADKNNNSNYVTLTKSIFASGENDNNKDGYESVIINNINTEKVCFEYTGTDIESSLKKSDKNQAKNENNNNNTKINEDFVISIDKTNKKDKEEIKNIITDTVKKISANEFSCTSSTPTNKEKEQNNNNNILTNNNNSNSNNSNKNMFENGGINSIISNNSKNNINTNENNKNNLQLKKDISDMNPLDMINQVITTNTNNSNIFSELQINTINTNNNNNSEEENKTVNENISNINLMDDSLEFSKSKSINTNNEQGNKTKQSSSKNNKSINPEGVYENNLTINEYVDAGYNNNLNNEKKINNDNKNENKKNINSNIDNNNNNIDNNNNDIINNNNKKRNTISSNNTHKISYHNNINKNNKDSIPNNNSYRNSYNNLNNKYIKKSIGRCSINQNDLSTLQNTSRENSITFISKPKICNNPIQYKESNLANFNKNNIENYNPNTTNYFQNNKEYLLSNPNLNDNNISLYSYNNTKNYSNYQNRQYAFSEADYNNNNIFNNNSKLSLNKKYNTFFNTSNNELSICSKQNIPNELLNRLREWLMSCDLLCYYNLLIKNNIYDIDKYINELKCNKINICYKDIEDIGIKKPGHIFRFLLKLQIDSGIIDNSLCNLIINKFNNNICTTIGLTASVNEIKCCGITLCDNGHNRSNNGSNTTKDSSYNDIFSFLRCKNLLAFKENFIHNGFDQIDFIIIQLFSNFGFTKEILNDYLHIYSNEDKKKVIHELYEEKRQIGIEIGYLCDEDEEEKILNTKNDVLSKKSSSIESDDSGSGCNIF